MNISRPAGVDPGDLFGKLRVLQRIKTKKGRIRYRVGCECGYSGMLVSSGQLRSGVRAACLKCADVKRTKCQGV